jgi:hypothetical protein
MSNDGRSIGEHLRDTERAVVPDSSDSSADSSATRQPGQGWQRDTDVTNRAPAEQDTQRVPPRRNRKDSTHAQ